MRAGSFREDLYYRINVVSVQVPPLRERREDIPLLAQHFLEKFSRQMNRPFRSIDAAAMERLVRHPWPGNVRELANAVERALVVGTPPAVREEDLPVRVGRETAAAAAGDSLAEIEREHVKRVLERKGWNVTHAAKALEIDPGSHSSCRAGTGGDQERARIRNRGHFLSVAAQAMRRLVSGRRTGTT